MFLWSATAHLIALTSPGPDTAITIRQISIHGRKGGIEAAIGIGFGILIHCILAITGISLIILSNDLYKFIISIIGSIYIFYLGISMYLNPNYKNTFNDKGFVFKNSFLIGFFTNIFNIKAFLFFISLFSILLESIYGIYYFLYPFYFSITSSFWFIFISYIFTNSKNKNLNIFSNKYISYLMSFILCLIGIYILITSINDYN